MKIIIHIDIDAFFASVEEVKNEKLKSCPFVVCCNNHSIIATANYVAREYGINSAMNIYDAMKILPQLKIINEDIEIYRNISNTFFKFIYENFTNNLEIASIDECYLDATNIIKEKFDNNLLLFCSDLKYKIKNKFGFNISIGTGPNKYISKIMANINKPNGCTIYNINTLLNSPIEYLSYINKETCKTLKLNKIHLISDFIKSENTIFLTNKLTKNKYNKIYSLLTNTLNEPLKYNFLKPNSISFSHNFKFPESNFKFIKKEIEILVKKTLNKANSLRYIYENAQVYFKYNKKLIFFTSKITTHNFEYLVKLLINLFYRN